MTVRAVSPTYDGTHRSQDDHMTAALLHHAWQHGFKGVQGAKVIQLHVLLEDLHALFKKAACEHLFAP